VSLGRYCKKVAAARLIRKENVQKKNDGGTLPDREGDREVTQDIPSATSTKSKAGGRKEISCGKSAKIAVDGGKDANMADGLTINHGPLPKLGKRRCSSK